jgi:hypothetical protein
LASGEQARHEVGAVELHPVLAVGQLVRIALRLADALHLPHHGRPGARQT